MLTFVTQRKRNMNTILLFGMPGGAELFLIVLVVIMVFGSKKIPELARGLGKGMREIKNATGDIQREITEGAREVNAIKDKVNIEKQVKDLIQEDKEKKSSVAEVVSQESGATPETKVSETSKEQESTNTQKPEAIPQTVQRRSPHKAQEPKNTSEKGE